MNAKKDSIKKKRVSENQLHGWLQMQNKIEEMVDVCKFTRYDAILTMQEVIDGGQDYLNYARIDYDSAKESLVKSEGTFYKIRVTLRNFRLKLLNTLKGI